MSEVVGGFIGLGVGSAIVIGAQMWADRRKRFREERGKRRMAEYDAQLRRDDELFARAVAEGRDPWQVYRDPTW